MPQKRGSHREMPGNTVAVSKAEAAALLEIITQALLATLDPRAKSFMF